MRNLAIACVAAAAMLTPATGRQSRPDEVEAAFAKFWAARTVEETEAVAAEIVASGAEFDDAWTRLKRGRVYANTVPSGPVRLQRRTALGAFACIVDVPQSYDATKKYQVRVQLHGGVMTRVTGEPRAAGGIGTLAGAEQIYVIPFAWRDAPWWSATQEENLRAILDTVKRTYNVDENRIVLAGVSDGATAAYYFAMRDTTPFAGFLALNGNIMVLANGQLSVGELFPANLLNKPLFVVNGGLDPLYPAAAVGPYVEHLQKSGVQVTYVVQPNGAHNTQWWPSVRDSFESFVRDHPRNPHPDRITWETERADAHNRAHWLVVDALRAPTFGVGSVLDQEPSLPDVNEFARDLVMTFGVVGSGTRVSVIQPGSNAERLGLRPGDTIVSINGRAFSSASELADALKTFHAGDQLVIVVSRTGRRAETQGVFQRETAPGIVMFPHREAWGRVDLVRVGNTVNARADGVAAFRLLLSPDVFDFSQPVKVVVNGRVAFYGRVERSVATLVKWAARDNDRTMLFGAELPITIH